MNSERGKKKSGRERVKKTLNKKEHLMVLNIIERGAFAYLYQTCEGRERENENE